MSFFQSLAARERESAATKESIAYIIFPVVGAMLFVALVGFLVFVSMARKKRSMHGKYNPQKQEFNSPRLELEMKIKPPPEERLI